MVTFVPNLNCGHCIACRLHKPNCCVQLQVCGVNINGAMTQFYQVPISALVVGQGLLNEQLALVEPLAIGAHGIERAEV